MDIIFGQYGTAIVHATNLEEHAVSQIKMILDNQISINSNVLDKSPNHSDAMINVDKRQTDIHPKTTRPIRFELDAPLYFYRRVSPMKNYCTQHIRSGIGNFDNSSDPL